MANTTRWIQPGWDGKTLASPPKSKKHQRADRPSSKVKNHRFRSGVKNSTHNLLQKDDKQLAAADQALLWLQNASDEELFQAVMECGETMANANVRLEMP